MATRVELPRELIKSALENAIALRERQIKAATNQIIKDALAQEQAALTTASTTLTETK